MKKAILTAALPLVMAACTGPTQPTVERQQLKDECVAGNYMSCADLGHIVHQQRLREADATG